MSQRKIVIKIGSSTLTDDNHRIDRDFLQSVADQVAHVRAAGWQPVIVTSAAIACGLEAMGLATRPTDIPSLQAAASVGQSALSGAYANAFAKHDITTSLILLTRRDTADRIAYLHARDTFERLLDYGVVPIVNENDTVSVEQIRFGDNDTLAALVACLIEADLVVILSDIDGLYDDNPNKNPDAKIISRVDKIDRFIMGVAGDAGSAVGSGGMITKIKAARVLMAAGIQMVICHGRAEGVIEAVAAEEAVGTRFVAHELAHEITPKKLWIALGDSVKGGVVIDDGAYRALVQRGSSLLCVGVDHVEGAFDAGDIVDVLDLTGHIVARGKVSCSSDELALGCGRSTAELEANRLLKPLAERPVMHRDELIVFD